MKVCVFGAGYVGLVTSACLADMGNTVVCVDVDERRVQRLQHGEVPIHEPGLDRLIERNAAAGRLAFTTDAEAAVGHSTLVFIAVGTPSGSDGEADVENVLAAAATVGRFMRDYKVVIDKSTVPVGTAARVREAIVAEQKARAVEIPFAVVSNPEFLKEGAAIDDFMRPDRIVVGSDDAQATLLMRALYSPFQRNHERMLVMDVRSAELTKYAANAMLATRISFMNELALLAETVGADIELVRQGIGSDPRIGTHFLYAGCGWGGSCLPKDVRALRQTAERAGTPLSILAAVQAVNDRQRRLLGDRIAQRFGTDLGGHVVAVWGLAFKPGTDDLREAPSLVLIEQLLSRGARVQAFDPVAMPAFEAAFGHHERLSMAADPYAAAEGADALAIVTEWREFRSPDFHRLASSMNQGVVFDGRNLYEPAVLREHGLEYVAIGRGS
jgi:UDPglucose 6-dehydrogenase